MTIFRRTENTPATILSKASDEGNCSTEDAMVSDGVFFLPSLGSRLGADGTSPEKLEVGLFMMRFDHDKGVYMKLTPKMLREIGGAMVMLAGQIERHAIAQADAALKKAAGQ